jgi:NADH-ubiquinone oxidoreductase chain 5
MYRIIRIRPLGGSIVAGILGWYIGEMGAIFMTCGSVLFSRALSVIAFYEVAINGNVVHLVMTSWMDTDMLAIKWGRLYDTLTVVILMVVRTVSSMVHVYSIEYMRHDPHRARFMSYLSLFTFFMLVLVTADNYVQMFVGWEGVGRCSYRRINFWFTRIQANKAAIKAIRVNRVGDVGRLLGMLVMYAEFKSLDYAVVFPIAMSSMHSQVYVFGYGFNTITMVTILMFIGVMGKSAQLGRHTWLPDAMEGPTPVSARIHAATMVTAGVFRRVRSSPLIEYAYTTLMVISVIGAATSLFAGSVGLVQHDMKRVIAYSTCSQLGYMVMACGNSMYIDAMFHLANHATFKARRFLSAGSVIHARSDEQDMRRMGGMVNIIPITYTMMLCGSVALAGLPFRTGFYSKDAIREAAFSGYMFGTHTAYWLGVVSAGCTSYYSWRLLYMVFLSPPTAYKSVIQHAHESPYMMLVPMFVRMIRSVLLGYYSKDSMVGMGTVMWGNSVYTHVDNDVMIDYEFVPSMFKRLPTVLGVVMAVIALYGYHLSSMVIYDRKIDNRLLYTFINRKWFFDKVYNEAVSQVVLHHGYHTTYNIVDRGMLERLGPEGITRTLYNTTAIMSTQMTGVRKYLIDMIVARSVLLIRYVVMYFTIIYA